MRKTKRTLFILLLLMNMTILPGCWNYKEISDKAVATGVAIDYDKSTDEVIMSVEVAVPVQKGEKMAIEPQVLEGRGHNFFDAARNSVTKTGRRVFWSHAKVIILGRSVADNHDKFVGVLDWFRRDAETRDDILMLYSMEKTAEEILTDIKIETESITSFYLEDMLKNEGATSKYAAVKLWEFTDQLQTEGISATIPTVRLGHYKDKVTGEIFGTAVFRGWQQVGWLDGTETMYYLMAADKMKGGILVIEAKKGKDVERISLEVFNNKAKIKPIYEDGELRMKIDVKTVVNIAEIDSQKDFIEEKNRETLKKIAEQQIKQRIEAVIHKTQKEYGTDIYGFGNKVEIEMPELWKEIKADWPEIYSKVKTDVHVEIKIQGSALRSKPIEVK
ncbi:MAG: Ger(x)C family spore germination protein [Bacillota bacterium]